MQPTHLVFTADDFGLSPAVDTAILESFRNGVVRVTALLVNFPDLEASVQRLRGEPQLEVGIHLNVTAGHPVLPSDRVHSLLAADGRFPGLNRFLGRYLAGRINLSEVRAEWAAQIEKGLSFGLRFVSITGHQHVHMLPRLAQISLDLPRQFQIPVVRYSRYLSQNILRPLHWKGWAINGVAALSRRRFQAAGVAYNDFVLAIPALGVAGALQNFRRLVQRLPGGVLEVVTHPGYVDDLLRERDPYVAGRTEELNFLTSALLRESIAQAGLRCTGFTEVLANGIAAGARHQEARL